MFSKRIYEHPQCEAIEMRLAAVIADSDPDATVSDPWTENEEVEW